MKVQCLQCGHEFEMTEYYHDELGHFTVCPKCDGSFDVDIDELYDEFVEATADENGEVDNNYFQIWLSNLSKTTE